MQEVTHPSVADGARHRQVLFDAPYPVHALHLHMRYRQQKKMVVNVAQELKTGTQINYGEKCAVHHFVDSRCNRYQLRDRCLLVPTEGSDTEGSDSKGEGCSDLADSRGEGGSDGGTAAALF